MSRLLHALLRLPPLSDCFGDFCCCCESNGPGQHSAALIIGKRQTCECGNRKKGRITLRRSWVITDDISIHMLLFSTLHLLTNETLSSVTCSMLLLLLLLEIYTLTVNPCAVAMNCINSDWFLGINLNLCPNFPKGQKSLQGWLRSSLPFYRHFRKSISGLQTAKSY